MLRIINLKDWYLFKLMLYVAHRGYSLEYIDNSIEAISEAVKRGYAGVEIDVQMCKTGELILYHDTYVANSFVSDISLGDAKMMGIITLEEMYAKIPGIEDVKLVLDIKGNNSSVVHALSTFYETRSTKNVTFCSFNRKILFLLPTHFKKGTTFEAVFYTDEYDMLTRNLSAVIIHWTCLDHSFISYCKYKDIEVYTYTHKEEKELEHMLKYNVDYVITNGISLKDK